MNNTPFDFLVITTHTHTQGICRGAAQVGSWYPCGWGQVSASRKEESGVLSWWYLSWWVPVLVILVQHGSLKTFFRGHPVTIHGNSSSLTWMDPRNIINHQTGGAEFWFVPWTFFFESEALMWICCQPWVFINWIRADFVPVIDLED